ncbi:MAG: cation transporter [Solirubrobacteraceae bacterium]
MAFPPARSCEVQPDRDRALAHALSLSVASVISGALIGTLSVTVGVAEHSVGVLGSGLGLLGDLAGSVMLVWRFHAERRHPVHAERAERRAARVVVGALAIVAVVVAVEATRALIAREHPGGSVLSLIAAAIAIVVLPPLAVAKRRTATELASHALRGDSSITALGAVNAVLALAGLALFHAFGWWWADRVAALAVALVAADEARTVRNEARVTDSS